MKHHLITGILLLVVILGAGLWASRYLRLQTAHAEKELELAFQLAAAGELDRAYAHGKRAELHWQDFSRLAACLVHHEELEETDKLFCELNARYETGYPAEYALLCRRLCLCLQDLTEKNSPALRNILCYF